MIDDKSCESERFWFDFEIFKQSKKFYATIRYKFIVIFWNLVSIGSQAPILF